MIEKELKKLNRDELHSLEEGVHAAVQGLKDDQSKPFYKLTETMLITLLIDINAAVQEEKSFSDGESL